MVRKSVQGQSKSDQATKVREQSGQLMRKRGVRNDIIFPLVRQVLALYALVLGLAPAYTSVLMPKTKEQHVILSLIACDKARMLEG